MPAERITTSISGVGTSWVTSTITTPAKYQIMRVKIYPVGTATQVAFKLSEKNTDQDVRLEYSLTSGSIDSIEAQDDIRVITKERKTSGLQGLSYLSVKCDTASNLVYIEIDIETLI